MRTKVDRIRQAVSFELIGVGLSTPLGAMALGYPLLNFGVLAVAGATIATFWNYLYNLLFDHALFRVTGSVKKKFKHRVLHAGGFEVGLAMLLIPLIAWWLDTTLLLALYLDLSFIAFYLVYTFVFTWAYDTLFPVPEPVASGN
jgi:uncharacterized membrane protein